MALPRWLWRLLACLLLACVAWAVLPVPPVAAHPVLLRAQPAAGSVTNASPREVRLTFSERVTVSSERLMVRDGAGRRVDLRDARQEAGAPATIIVSVPTLPNGVYTVSYSLLSDDSHLIRGALRFGVGVSLLDLQTSDARPVAPALDRLMLLDAAARWLNLLGLVLLAGPAAFFLLVLRPELAAGGSDEWAATRDRFLTGTLWWGWLGAAVSLLAALLALLAVAGGGLTGGFAATLTQQALGAALWSRFGLLWALWLAVLVVPVLAFDWLAGKLERAAGADEVESTAPDTRFRGLWVIVGAGAVLALVTSLRGHAVTTSPVALSVLLDLVHVLATVVWLGGLFALAVVLPRAWRVLTPDGRHGLLAVVAPRFSSLALLCVQVLLVTGLYQVWAHVDTPASLSATPYGRALLGKLALVVPLVALGAVQRLVVLPRLRQSREAIGGASGAVTHRLARSLRWTLGGEVALSVGVLLLVGLLTALPPARQVTATGVAPATSEQPVSVAPEVTLATNAGDYLVTLTVGPTGNGPAVLTATVQDVAGTAIEDATLLARLLPSGGATAQETPLVARRGRYLGSGDLARQGHWNIELLVTPRGREQVTARFAVTLPAGGALLLLADADAAMNRLTTMRERQTLRGAGGTVTTEYLFAAPDRLQIASEQGAETIVVGNRRYDRAPPNSWLDNPWPEAEGYRWPRYAYARNATEVTLLGREEVDGASCWVVTFVETEGGVRFTVWIGERDSLIRQVWMYAPGHYMESRFSDFNVPIAIEPPR